MHPGYRLRWGLQSRPLDSSISYSTTRSILRSFIIADGGTYDVVVSEVRPIASDRVSVLGEVRSEGRQLSPSAVLVRIRNGLIVESRSYLSDPKLLEELQVLEDSRRHLADASA